MILKCYWMLCPTQHKDDLKQSLSISLAKCAKTFKPNGHTFGAHAFPRLCNAAKSFLFGRGRLGSATNRDADRFERSLGEIIGVDEDGEITLGDFIERGDARRELSDDVAEDHLAARLFDIRSALKTLKTLTPRERKVLKFRYVQGLTLDETSEKIGLSQVRTKRICRSGIRKLRAHFADSGALPADAPIPRDVTPDYAHWHWETPPTLGA